MKVWLATVAVALATTGLLVLGAFHSTPADDFGLSGLGRRVVRRRLAGLRDASARWSPPACPATDRADLLR